VRVPLAVSYLHAQEAAWSVGWSECMPIANSWNQPCVPSWNHSVVSSLVSSLDTMVLWAFFAPAELTKHSWLRVVFLSWNAAAARVLSRRAEVCEAVQEVVKAAEKVLPQQKRWGYRQTWTDSWQEQKQSCE